MSHSALHVMYSTCNRSNSKIESAYTLSKYINFFTVQTLFVLLSVIPVTFLFIRLMLCEGNKLFQLEPCRFFHLYSKTGFRTLHIFLRVTKLIVDWQQVEQEAQGPWRSAWTEDPVHKSVLKSCKYRIKLCYLRY